MYFEALSGALTRGWAPVRGVIRGGLKYIDLPIVELYDLAADPTETRNLAAERPADVRALKGLVDGFPIGPARARAESPAERARLTSLGYVSGGSTLRASYTASDDPKRLIAVDRDLQEIVGRYVAGDAGGALSAARALSARHPRMALAWLQLAHLERETGNLKGGIAALERARAIEPSNAQAAALLGAYLTQDGRAREAMAMLAPFAAADDADVEILRALALATARGGGRGLRGTPGPGEEGADAALALLRRARRVDPEEAQLLVDEGTIALMANRREDARAAFEQALARDPALARAHSSLAAMAADEGRAAEAAAHWRDAAARDPSEYGRIYALGVAQARAGRVAAARVALEFFAASAPRPRYAAEIARAQAWLAGTR